jgi:hypothetical protein
MVNILVSTHTLVNGKAQMKIRTTIAGLTITAAAFLCGWYGGSASQHKRIKSEFENTQATIVVHCGPISEHELAAREKYFPVMDDMQRMAAAYQAAYDMDGYVEILGNCAWKPDTEPSAYWSELRRFP